MKNSINKKNLVQPAEMSNTLAPAETGQLNSDKAAEKPSKEKESERKNAERVALDRVAPSTPRPSTKKD